MAPTFSQSTAASRRVPAPSLEPPELLSLKWPWSQWEYCPQKMAACRLITVSTEYAPSTTP